MDFTIRPFSEGDYEAVCQVGMAAIPDMPLDPDELRHMDASDAQYRRGRWVAEAGGRVLGMGEYYQQANRFHPRKFSVDVWVHPDFQGRGIGSALYRQLEATLRPLEPIAFLTNTREDLPGGLRFLQQRGFTEISRHWQSFLDVQTFDPAPYADVEDRVLARGVELSTLAAQADDPDRFRKLYDLWSVLQQDVPSTEAPTPMPFAEYFKNLIENPHFLPEGQMLAIHQGRYVGLSALWRSSEPDTLRTGLTGTCREYRRQGIALALKLRAVAFARALGARQIYTFNASTNRPMLAINEQMGFVKKPAWVDFERTFE